MTATQPTRLLKDLPDAMKFLPRDKRGFPVPRFVAWIDGEPDFRVIRSGWFADCINNNKCWLCGGQLGTRKWFVIGPMCCINHVTSEPPCHRGCAEFAAKNCPFLTRPLAKRNAKDLPANIKQPAGVAIPRNPGVTALWETVSWQLRHVDPGYLIFLGPPQAVTFYREGRIATRLEVEDSVNSGMDVLIDAAMKQDLADGNIVTKPAMQELMRSAYMFGKMLNDTYGKTPDNDDAPPPEAS